MSEICIRCVYHPIHIKSNGQIKREALLPMKGGTDVSLLRKEYMSIEQCIEHGKNINMNGNTFTALASITRADVEQNNVWAQEQEDLSDIGADIYYAPMHNNEYVSLEKDVYTDDEENCNLPAHADLKYNTNYDLENDEVKTKLRKFVSSLVKKMVTVNQE